MLQVQYAAANSKGVLAPLIGWIDFGTLLSLTQHSATATVSNAIAGGYLISFEISLSLQGNPAAASQVKLEGTTIPTTSFAPLGTTAYTGIPGHVALYMPSAPPNNNEVMITLVLRNICVTNCQGKMVDDYFFIAADSGITRQIANSAAEIWSVSTDGSPWELVEEMPASNGYNSGAPIVSGIGTRTVTESGTVSTRESTSANVFLTQSPTQVIAKASVDGSRQGFAFGVIIPDKNNCYMLPSIRSSHINYVNPPQEQVTMLPLKACDQLTSIIYNSTCLPFYGNPVLITGQLGTYLFFEHYVLFSGFTTLPKGTFDIFSLVISRNNSSMLKFIVFGTKSTHQHC